MTSCSQQSRRPYWGDLVPAWLDYQLEVLEHIHADHPPLEQELTTHQSESVAHVVSQFQASFFILLLFNHSVARQVTTFWLHPWFKILGRQEPTGVFRPIHSKAPLPLSEFFGHNAINDLRKLKATKPPRDSDKIEELTAEEIAKHQCTPWLTEQHVNSMFGIGQGCALYRCVIVQLEKLRLIDDGARGLQNACASESDTIYTTSVDFIPEAARLLLHFRLAHQYGLQSGIHDQHAFSTLSPEDGPTFGTDDLPEAVRGVPLCPADRAAAVVAVWDMKTHAWKFSVMNGAPYGLGRIVHTFNRYPTRVIAAARRVLARVITNYFDDVCNVSIVKLGRTQSLVTRRLFGLFGTPPKEQKSFCNKVHGNFLGAHAKMSAVVTTVVRILPKYVSRVRAKRPDR